MNPENRNLAIGIAVVMIVIIGGYAALINYTGLSTPFSVVMSESMQHDPYESRIGCIDTGDVVIVKEADADEIQSYIEGTVTGHRSFGDYGSVIIYERGSDQNPVIHRAIIWLDWDGSKWSSPDLVDYAGEWYCAKGNSRSTNPYNLEGMLHLKDVTASGKDVAVNLDRMTKNSGYLTMGDNPIGNTNFDQTTGIADGPVPMEKVKSIPIAEIPWIGAVKVSMKGDNMEHAPNSIPSLLMTIVTIFSIIILIDVLNHRNTLAKAKEEKGKYRF